MSHMDADSTERKHRPGQDDLQFPAQLAAQHGEELILCVKRHLRHYPLLRRVCDAEDIVQNTWESLARSIRQGRRLKSVADLFAMLRRCARNQTAKIARHYLTTAKRDLRCQTSLDATDDVADCMLDPARAAECKDILEECLNRLTEEEQLLFELRCLEDCRISEIALRMNVDPRDVSRSLEDLLVKLRDFWHRLLPYLVAE